MVSARASEAAGVKISDLEGDNRRGRCSEAVREECKNKALPAVAANDGRSGSVDRTPADRQPCFPEPLRCSDNSLRNPYTGRKTCEAGQRETPVFGQEAG
jgi:hypothetical protein